MFFFFHFDLKTKFIYIFCLSHSLFLDNVNKTQELGIYVRNINLKQFYTKRKLFHELFDCVEQKNVLN